MPRHDEPYMQPHPLEPEHDPFEGDHAACPRCWEDLGRADPMCPACGSDENVARGVQK